MTEPNSVKAVLEQLAEAEKQRAEPHLSSKQRRARTVSRLAAMFSQNFAKRPLPVEDFLGHTFSSMFETELNRAGKSRKKQARKGEVAEVPLRHEEMDALFGGGGAVAVLDFAA